MTSVLLTRDAPEKKEALHADDAASCCNLCVSHEHAFFPMLQASPTAELWAGCAASSKLRVLLHLPFGFRLTLKQSQPWKSVAPRCPIPIAGCIIRKRPVSSLLLPVSYTQTARARLSVAILYVVYPTGRLSVIHFASVRSVHHLIAAALCVSCPGVMASLCTTRTPIPAFHGTNEKCMMPG